MLIVDNSKNIRRLIAIVLKAENFILIEAENGREALKKIENESPDIVIMDIVLPVMDGLECCFKIKNDPKTENIKVLILTAESNARKKAFLAGADDFMCKPFDPDQLRAAIRGFIG